MITFSSTLVTSAIILFTKFSVLMSQCSSSTSRAASDSDCYLNHLARENVIRMGQEGGCDSPKPQIVYPQHSSSKTYMPRGTILHRCNDQSGCCPQKEHSCQAVAHEELRVAFYAIDCTSGDSRPTAEYVNMKNHTKCMCQSKSDDSMYDSRGMSTPQRLVDSVCGQRSGRGSAGFGSRGSSVSGRTQMMHDLTYSKPFYGDPHYGQSSYAQSSGIQSDGYRTQPQSQRQPCNKDQQSTRPLVDGQIVRGTIRVIISGSDQYQQQQGCPYG